MKCYDSKPFESTFFLYGVPSVILLNLRNIKVKLIIMLGE